MQLERIVKEHYDKLNENDLYIWKYILQHKEECKKLSIQQLAARCNVSHTTIYRFVKKLELDNYNELKFYLKKESNQEEPFDKREIGKVYQDIVKTMEDLVKAELYDIYEMLKNAGRIYAYGTGTVQELAARDLGRLMLVLGYVVNVLEGKDETGVILNQVQKDDVVFLYSFSGDNSFVNEFAQRLKARGVKIISITQKGTNELSFIADVALQFYCHSVQYKNSRRDLYMVSPFYVINELMLLKLMELHS